jgi:hypothetical protein
MFNEENMMQVQTAHDAAMNEENELTSELNEPRWSVVSFESVAVRNQTYAEAKQWLEKLQKQNISGLCIVTDEAAERMTQ